MKLNVVVFSCWNMICFYPLDFWRAHYSLHYSDIYMAHYTHDSFVFGLSREITLWIVVPSNLSSQRII